MKLMTLCLAAGLLCIPVASRADGSLKISVRLDLRDLPAGNSRLSLRCAVGVGPPPAGAFTTWEPATLVAEGAFTFGLDEGTGRSVRRNAVMPLVAIPPGTLGEATHYQCWVTNVAGQPRFRGPEVSGPIRR